MVAYNDSNGKSQQTPPPPPPPFDEFDEWGDVGYENSYDESYNGFQSYDNYVPPTYLDALMPFDGYEASPTNPPAQHTTLNPSPLPSTIGEHLDNLFKWPRLDPNITIVARPPTTSAQLRA